MKTDFRSKLKEKGLSINDLADCLGVTERQARNYLNGYSIPHGKKALLLAKLLGVSAEIILLAGPDQRPAA